MSRPTCRNIIPTKAKRGDIEIVAFNAGLHILPEDTSPVKARLKSFKQGTRRLVHRLREHAGGDDPHRRQGTTAGGECLARAGRRSNADRTGPRGRDHPASVTPATRKHVAGRQRCYEEATLTASRPAEPHGPRRCGGPEHSAGCYAGIAARAFGAPRPNLRMER